MSSPVKICMSFSSCIHLFDNNDNNDKNNVDDDQLPALKEETAYVCIIRGNACVLFQSQTRKTIYGQTRKQEIRAPFCPQKK